jgi:hypothetical protein
MRTRILREVFNSEHKRILYRMKRKYLYQSSVRIETGYGLDGRETGVRFPAGARYFSFFYSVQTGSGANGGFCGVGTGGFSPGDKSVGTRC